jgi:hypothetical protein
MHDIDSVIAGMYDSVSFEMGSRPDWKRHDEIFAPGARMARITDDGVFEFDNRSYQENVDGMIEAGTLTSFWEAELWRETHLFDEMAHVLSAYEARRSRGGELIGRGVNSIQLFRKDGRWWISAMLWRREGRSVRIPDSVPAALK